MYMAVVLVVLVVGLEEELVLQHLMKQMKQMKHRS
jgi:hypothetical protein